MGKTPKHIAFIMDGNRRWARSNKLALIMGHNKGVDRVEELTEYADSLGIEYVTFWAFSTENWNRAKEEVEDLMTVFRTMVNGPMIKRMMEKGVRVLTIGDISAFPKDIYQRLEEIKQDSSHNEGITTTFALNYGGRFEILSAINAVVANYSSSDPPAGGESRSNNEAIEQFSNDSSRLASRQGGQTRTITEEEFSDYLFTKDVPDPDLLIRTGGEQRTSGFMPWQTTYTELYFTETLWPEFDTKALQKALDDFTSRERRFGK